MNTLSDVFNNFGFITITDICVLKLKEYKKYGQLLKPSDFNKDECLRLDTLKLANIKEKGPSHTFKAGQLNTPVRRIGNAITIDIQDALGKLDSIYDFFNFQAEGQRLYRNNMYADPFALEGKISVINTKGQITYIYMFIPCFLPNGLMNINLQTEKEFGVFDLSGVILPTFFSTNKPHLEWYSLSPYSIFDDRINSSIYIMNGNTVNIKSSFAEADAAIDNYIYNEDVITTIPILDIESNAISSEEAITLSAIYNADYIRDNKKYIYNNEQVAIELQNS